MKSLITSSLTAIAIAFASPVFAQELDPGSQFLTLGNNRLIVHTEIEIDAAPQEVWAAISDFETIGTWSPHLKTVVGDLEDNALVTAIYDFGTGNLLRNPVELTWNEGRRFGWSGGTLYGPEVYDNHMFYIVPLADGRTRFVHTDDLTFSTDEMDVEALIPTFVDFFQSFNTALKAHVEADN